MSTVARESVLSRLAAFQQALDAAPASGAVDRVRYHSERLEHAVRSSHGEGIRFAAYTMRHALTTEPDRFSPAIAQAFAELTAALTAAGHHF